MIKTDVMKWHFSQLSTEVQRQSKMADEQLLSLIEYESSGIRLLARTETYKALSMHLYNIKEIIKDSRYSIKLIDGILETLPQGRRK